MTLYAPNIGEKEMLKADIAMQAVVLGIYKNVISIDGGLTIDSLTEMSTAGGYAPIVLTNDLNESAAAANQWYVSTDANGKASAQYGLTANPQTWTFNATDVAAAETLYGIYAYTRVLAFTSGLQPIRVGDVVRQGAVVAEVTGVIVKSGSWYAGTAAGDLYLKRQSGTFAAGATLIDLSKATATSEIKGLTAAPVVGGTGYAVGDIFSIGTGTGGVGRVTAVTAGVVTAVELLTGGKDYTVATQATTKINGSGDDALTVAVATLYTAGPAVAVATIAGDSTKKLLWTEAFSAAKTVGYGTGEVVGVTYLPIRTLATA